MSKVQCGECACASILQLLANLDLLNANHILLEKKKAPFEHVHLASRCSPCCEIHLPLTNTVSEPDDL